MVIEGQEYDKVWNAARKVVLAYKYNEAEIHLFGGEPRDEVTIVDKEQGKLVVSPEQYLGVEGRLIALVHDQGAGRVRVTVQAYRLRRPYRLVRSRSQSTERRVLHDIRRLCEKEK